jgi:BRO family, N-terminal domain/Meiotically up-regulated gene 113
MLNLSPFQYENHTIRAQTGEAGEPWFNANDVCGALGYAHPIQALASHVERGHIRKMCVLTAGGPQQVNYISEQGVYKLIMGSRRPNAAKLKDKLLSQINGLRVILESLKTFEVPDDIPDMYVYAIRNTVTGNVKLGISRNPEARVKQLQIGNDCKLELVAYQKAYNRFADERALHIANQSKRIIGEWFSGEAVEAIPPITALPPRRAF